MDKLRACAHPLLLVEGVRDRLVQPGWARRMAGELRRGSWATVEGAHSPHLDHADELLDVMLPFLAEHSPRGCRYGDRVGR
jgi:pimeloyl-ACP methyl ester carboxylesterase